MALAETWVLDAGNSRLKFALVQGQKLIKTWQVPTPSGLDDLELESLSGGYRLPKRLVYSSVVPKKMAPTLKKFAAASIAMLPVDLAVLETQGFYSEATGVGIDRLVAGFAGWREHKRDLLVVDLGTATTFDLISHKGRFLGGAIFPGVELCKQTLIEHAEALGEVALAYPESIIGKNSTQAIQSGILFGYTSLVETMLVKIAASHGAPLLSIATGGLAPLICQHTQTIEAIKPNLTLEGLAILADLQA